MTTIGYGDITPATVYQKVYVIFVSFIASGIFAYAIVKLILKDMSLLFYKFFFFP